MTALPLDTIACSDALEFVTGSPDASVDLIVIDPPYNMTALSFEAVVDWAAFWQQARRVLRSKHCPVVCFSQQPFTTDLIASNRKEWRFEIIWHKTMPVGFLDAKRRPLRIHESIQIFSLLAPVYFPTMAVASVRRASVKTRHGRSEHYGKHNREQGWDDGMTRYPTSVWQYAQRHNAFENTSTLHPTEKPLPLITRLIETFSCENDVVLDCFCGSGTTAVAARNTGRHWLCCDNGIDEKTGRTWADIATERLTQSDPFENRDVGHGLTQLSMFSGK